jgi:hypothetical protein
MQGANVVYVQPPPGAERGGDGLGTDTFAQIYEDGGGHLAEENVASAINNLNNEHFRKGVRRMGVDVDIPGETEKPHAATDAAQGVAAHQVQPTTVVMTATAANNYAQPGVVSDYDAQRYARARQQRLRAGNDAVVGVPVINTYQADTRGRAPRRHPVTPPARPPQRDNFVTPKPSAPPADAEPEVGGSGLVDIRQAEVDVHGRTAYRDVQAPHGRTAYPDVQAHTPEKTDVEGEGDGAERDKRPPEKPSRKKGDKKKRRSERL